MSKQKPPAPLAPLRQVAPLLADLRPLIEQARPRLSKALRKSR